MVHKIQNAVSTVVGYTVADDVNNEVIELPVLSNGQQSEGMFTNQSSGSFAVFVLLSDGTTRLAPFGRLIRFNHNCYPTFIVSADGRRYRCGFSYRVLSEETIR